MKRFLSLVIVSMITLVSFAQTPASIKCSSLELKKIAMQKELNGERIAKTAVAPRAKAPKRKAAADGQVTEDFESYEVGIFTTGDKMGPWSAVDGDGEETYGWSGFNWTYSNETYAFAIMNFPGVFGNATDIVAPSGNQALMFMSTCLGNPADDWFISPELVGTEQTITFMGRPMTTQYGPEEFEVLASSTDTNPESFIKINDFSASADEWSEYMCTLPAGSKYFAIHYISNDVFCLYIDDLKYYPAAEDPDDGPKDVTIRVPGTQWNTNDRSYSCTVEGVTLTVSYTENIDSGIYGTTMDFEAEDGDGTVTVSATSDNATVSGIVITLDMDPKTFDGEGPWTINMNEGDKFQISDFTVHLGGDDSGEIKLNNGDFAEGNVGEVNIATYAKDGEVHQMQEVPGWTFGVENGDARAAGVVAYGSGATLGDPTYGVPAAGPEGTNGYALGMVGVWMGTVQYVQDVTLPAGKYTMTVPVYNTTGISAFKTNLIGVMYGETKNFAAATSYPVGEWTVETIKFELAEETKVTLSLGYEAANVGSAAAQHLFLDCVKLMAESAPAPKGKYAHVNLDGYNENTAQSAQVGHVWANIDKVGKVTAPFDDTWKVSDIQDSTTGYNYFYAGETALNTSTKAIMGQSNGKDSDGGNPATTLKPFAQGAAFKWHAETDGYLTIFFKGESSKQYVLFEDGKAVGYEYAQLAKISENPEVVTYTLTVGEEGVITDAIKSVEENVNKSGFTSKKGAAAMRFPVSSDLDYLFGCTGAKMQLLGVYFNTVKDEISVSKPETADQNADPLVLLKGSNSNPPTHQHDYATTWSYDENNHWHACNGSVGSCDATRSGEAAHSYGNVATETSYYTCSACQYVNTTRQATYQAAVDQAAATNVVNMINSIGTVTLESKNAIDAARTAYNNLTATQQALVTNLQTLVDAETEYARLKAIDDVEKTIDAIGTVELTEDSKALIDAAREAYDKLPEADQEEVENYQTLVDAEAEYARLKAIDDVEKTIDAIGVVEPTDECKALIEAAREAYDALPEADKEEVENYQTLLNAEEAYLDFFMLYDQLELTAFDGNSYYATFSSRKPVFVEFKANVLTVKVDGTKLKLDTSTFFGKDVKEEVEDGYIVNGTWVPANTGVLLKSYTNNVRIWTYGNKKVNKINNVNFLRPAAEEMQQGYKFYMLAYGDEDLTPHTLGFYYGAEDGAPFEARKGSAYLAVPENVEAKGFCFADDATAIKNVDAEDAANATYNLQGQRVKSSQKGIVIVNGKKVVK